MKRISIFLLLIILMIVLIFISSGKTVSIGRYYSTGTNDMIITDTEPMYLQNDNVFSNVDIGDKILVIRNSVANECYPMQTNAYFCFKLSDGTAEDISQEILDTFIISTD